MIIPCIDLLDGRVVQLVRGERKVLERSDYLGLARYFGRLGEFNVVDLDAAKGTGENLAIIKEICGASGKARVGGGIRSVEAAERVLGFGAKKVIIGSAAYASDGIDYDFLEKFSRRVGKERMIIAVDSRGGKITVRGWRETINLTPYEAIMKLEQYCSEFLCTFVEREGLMNGTDLSSLRKLAGITRNKIAAAGGICSKEEVAELEKLGIDSVVGMALYTGRLGLTDCALSVFDGDWR